MSSSYILKAALSCTKPKPRLQEGQRRKISYPYVHNKGDKKDKYLWKSIVSPVGLPHHLPKDTIIPTFHKRKLRLREARRLTQGHSRAGSLCHQGDLPYTRSLHQSPGDSRPLTSEDKKEWTEGVGQVEAVTRSQCLEVGQIWDLRIGVYTVGSQDPPCLCSPRSPSQHPHPTSVRARTGK